jgi:hypothetical protein
VIIGGGRRVGTGTWSPSAQGLPAMSQALPSTQQKRTAALSPPPPLISGAPSEEVPSTKPITLTAKALGEARWMK